VIAVAIAVGIAIGLLLGALGGGGSILAVPALVYLLDQTPHAATSGALVVVGLSALVATVAHARAGRVRPGTGVAFGIFGAAGTYLGTRAATHVDPNLLLAGFAVLMTVTGAGMLRQHPAGPAPVGAAPDPTGGSAAGGGTSPVRTATRPAPHRHTTGRSTGAYRAARLVATAVVVGLLTGVFGVGGGFVIVPALVLVIGLDLATAVGTSLLVITLNAGTALAARADTLATLNWALLAVFTTAAITGSLAGHRITTRVPPRTLSTAFAVLCLLLAGYIAVRTMPHLLPW